MWKTLFLDVVERTSYGPREQSLQTQYLHQLWMHASLQALQDVLRLSVCAWFIICKDTKNRCSKQLQEHRSARKHPAIIAYNGTGTVYRDFSSGVRFFHTLPAPESTVTAC